MKKVNIIVKLKLVYEPQEIPYRKYKKMITSGILSSSTEEED